MSVLYGDIAGPHRALFHKSSTEAVMDVRKGKTVRIELSSFGVHNLEHMYMSLAAIKQLKGSKCGAHI